MLLSSHIVSSRSGQPIERGFLLDRRRVLASSRRYLSLPRQGFVSGRRSRAGRREDVFGAPGCLRGVQGSVSGAEEGGVRVFQLAFAGLGRRGRRGLGVLPKFGSRGWLLVERPQAPCPPRRVRVLLDRRKRNLHHMQAHSGRLSGRRRDVHQLRVHALGRSGHLLELEGTRGERGWRRRGDLAPPRRWRRYLAQRARIGASTISLVEPLALIVAPAPPPLMLCFPGSPHTVVRLRGASG